MKVVVVSSDYPSPELIYGDVFVHARLKQYRHQVEVVVLGLNEGQAERKYVYEGIPVYITNSLEIFCREVITHQPQVIVCHLVQFMYVDFLLTLKIPKIIFAHGFEATSWKRRLMNYTSPTALYYLWQYRSANIKQLKQFKKLAIASNTSAIQFVFVSRWLQNAVEKDIGVKIGKSHVISNGIDTSLFNYTIKDPEQRKKILLIRSFKARNYGNDIAIDAILRLSKKAFFNELEFAIYGEGYLFKKLVRKVQHLTNVKCYNFFIENKNIPKIHKEFGIFLCPSRMDSQGVSMCEAMASGLVPVTTPIGGIPEFVKHDTSGFMEITAEAIAERISYLYHQPREFERVSKNARLSIEENCSLLRTTQKELALINSVSNG